MDDEYFEKLIDTADRLSIWKPASVQEEPEVSLVRWRVFEVDFGSLDGKTIHFVGSHESFGGGRVCSPVQTYDPETKRGITRSGRIYELIRNAGYDSDAEYVWGMWLKRNGNPKYVEITELYDV
jgi:hypothetical protein